MVLFSALCIGLGIAPGALYAMLPFKVDFVPYTASHVVFQLQLLLFSGLAFFLMLDWLARTLTITLDVDWLYRGLGPKVAKGLDRWAEVAWLAITRTVERGVWGAITGIRRHHGPEGVLGRSWPTGSMAFWTTLMLAAYLILSYL
jgi:multicomponent Na+:H+ antiporter subunit D